MGPNNHIAPAVKDLACQLIGNLAEELTDRFESLEDASARAGYFNRILRSYAKEFQALQQMAERQIESR